MIDLTSIASKLKTDKWLLTHEAYNSLASQIAVHLTNPNVEIVIDEPEFIVEEAPEVSNNNIALIYISGILVKGASEMEEKLLGLCNTDNIAQEIDKALINNKVSEICLVFNSPGGQTNGIEELGRKIAQADNIKPIKGWSETLCASAAYWLISQCRMVGITPSTSIGSIGVYSVIEDVTKAMEMAGIAKEAIYSGKYKLLGANFRSLTDEERKMLQDDITKQHQKFKMAITSKRTIDDSYMEGLSYEGEEALEGNLVDIVVDNINQFLTTSDLQVMTKAINIAKPVAEAPVIAKLAEAPEKKDEPKTQEAPEKKEDVEGVPGTKAESGHYDGGYVMCPACKLTYKLEHSHYAKGPEVEKTEETVDEVVKEKPADQPKEDKPVDAELKKEAKEDEVPEKKDEPEAPVKKAVLPDLSKWNEAFGYVKSGNAFLTAAEEFAKQAGK